MVLDLAGTGDVKRFDLSFGQKLSDAEGVVCRGIVVVQDPPHVLPQVAPLASDPCNQPVEHFFAEVLVYSWSFAYLLRHQFDTSFENLRTIGRFFSSTSSFVTSLYVDFGRKMLNVWKHVKNQVLE